MPLIKYQCQACGEVFSRLYRGDEEIKKTTPCAIVGCEGKALKLLGAPKSMSTQVIDNGGNTRPVEVSHSVVDAERDKIEKGYADYDKELRKPY